MTFKGLTNPINIQEQKLETPNRTGIHRNSVGERGIWIKSSIKRNI